MHTYGYHTYTRLLLARARSFQAHLFSIFNLGNGSRVRRSSSNSKHEIFMHMHMPSYLSHVCTVVFFLVGALSTLSLSSLCTSEHEMLVVVLILISVHRRVAPRTHVTCMCDATRALRVITRRVLCSRLNECFTVHTHLCANYTRDMCTRSVSG